MQTDEDLIINFVHAFLMLVDRVKTTRNETTSKETSTDEAKEEFIARIRKSPNLINQPKGKKLTNEEALDIYKEDRLTQAELAELFDVSLSTVYQIKHGITWWRLTGHPRYKGKNQ